MNRTAIGVYERLGFVITDEREAFGPGRERQRCMMTQALGDRDSR